MKMSPSPFQVFLASCLLTSMVLACGSPSSPPERPTSFRDVDQEVPVFRDASVAAGIDFQHVNGASGGLHSAEIMGSGAAWLDVDGDGDLDLFLLQGNRKAMQSGTDPALSSQPQKAPRDRLLRNEWIPSGELSFVDITAASGIEGFGYSMGVAVGDVDRDGDDDLYVTVFGAADRLWLGSGDGTFIDGTTAAGLGDPRWTTSAAWADFDGDGWLDLVVASGAVRLFSGRAEGEGTLPQPNHLFLQRPKVAAGMLFEEVGEQAGAAFAVLGTSRGVALGDVDNDGDPDLLVTNNGGRARLLLNLQGQDRPWLGLVVIERSGSVALGARLGIHRRRGPTLWRRVHSDGSYLSARDSRVLVGLGDDPEITAIEVRWVGGGVEDFGALELGRYHTLRRGAGRPRG